jgi:hypothetical protein
VIGICGEGKRERGLQRGKREQKVRERQVT